MENWKIWDDISNGFSIVSILGLIYVLVNVLIIEKELFINLITIIGIVVGFIIGLLFVIFLAWCVGFAFRKIYGKLKK